MFRYLTEDNILVERDGFIKLIDFEKAKQIEEGIIVLGNPLGTLEEQHYWAPEMMYEEINDLANFSVNLLASLK